MPDAKVHVAVSAFDKALEKEASEYYRLSIQLSQDGFSFCILDTRRNKYLGLQSINFSNITGPQVFNQVLGEVIPGISWLRLPYEFTRIIYESRISTLIPEALFHPDRARDYLAFNHPLSRGEPCFDDHLPTLAARNLWAMPAAVRDTLLQYFPAAGIHHHAGALIESLLIRYKHSPPEDRVFAHIRNGWFDIVVMHGGQLRFYNSFRYNVREDFIYYLIYVLEQLNLNPETVSLIFLGEIMKTSALHDIAYKYVRHISFGTRNPAYDYSYVLDEIPEHFYFNLLNLQQCEL